MYVCVCVPVDCTVVYRIYHTNTVLFSDVLFRGKKTLLRQHLFITSANPLKDMSLHSRNTAETPWFLRHDVFSMG